MRWRYGVGALDRGSRARRRNTRSRNGHRAVARTVAAQNVLPQLKAGTPLEVFAYDRANVKMLATGRPGGSDDSQIDTTTGTVKVRAQFDNPDNALFPNQFVSRKIRRRIRSP